MKVTVEHIEGRPHTVVWATEDISSVIWVENHCAGGFSGCISTFEGKVTPHIIATALPPLPRNPKPEHAWLFSLYNAHGLYPAVESEDGDISQPTDCSGKLFFFHCLEARLVEETDRVVWVSDATGERVSVAITEESQS